MRNEKREIGSEKREARNEKRKKKNEKRKTRNAKLVMEKWVTMYLEIINALNLVFIAFS